MSQITFKKLTGNVPGKDTRGETKPKATAKVNAVSYKNAVMGRSKLGSKHGTHKTIID